MSVIKEEQEKKSYHIESKFNCTMSEFVHNQLLQQIREEGGKVNPHPLLQRQFLSISNHNKENKELNGLSDDDDNITNIRLFQWNLLAQGLCQEKDSFILCPKAALTWESRCYHMLEELLTYNPDILCLQEVDQFSFLESYLNKVGYLGVFFPKPDSPCLYTANNSGPDGCAIFWNVHKVKLMNHSNLVLEAKPGCATNQVAIICKFQTKNDGKEFFVATTHLKSKVSYHKLRLLQGSFLEEYLCKHCNGAPLLLSGDFNAEPSEAIINVFKNSTLDFCSSYSLLSDSRSEPPYTTWKVRGTHKGREETCHTIDYLFFTSKYFKCRQLLHLPTHAEMGEGLLPSFTYPSDHLSLVADFQIAS